jgi:hypothetical protein
MKQNNENRIVITSQEGTVIAEHIKGTGDGLLWTVYSTPDRGEIISTNGGPRAQAVALRGEWLICKSLAAGKAKGYLIALKWQTGTFEFGALLHEGGAVKKYSPKQDYMINGTDIILKAEEAKALQAKAITIGKKVATDPGKDLTPEAITVPQEEELTVNPVNPVNSKPKNKGGRPRTQFKQITKSSQDGTKEGEVRATFIVREDLLGQLKAVSFWERTMLKTIIDTALRAYIEGYVLHNGPIKPISK